LIDGCPEKAVCRRLNWMIYIAQSHILPHVFLEGFIYFFELWTVVKYVLLHAVFGVIPIGKSLCLNEDKKYRLKVVLETVT
jgi:membrane-bound acyltransferase YfiQ involved in biofilm formation